MTLPEPAALARRLAPVFAALSDHYGPQRWWPADQPFEMIAGALLVQNTAWTNAATALDNLRAARALSPAGILRLSEPDLQHLVRPSGYYRQKAAKLRAFARHVHDAYDDDLNALLAQPDLPLRRELLSIWGVGAETADAILLYAARRPSFVVDTYTARILSRLGIVPVDPPRDALRTRLMQALPPNAAHYAEWHALLVRHAKDACRKTPDCPACPLLAMCRFGSGARLR